MSLSDTCPKCNADLRGEPIPQEYQHMYAEGATHYSRLIGIYSRERDATTHWKCPFCKEVWERE